MSNASKKDNERRREGRIIKKVNVVFQKTVNQNQKLRRKVRSIA